MKGRAIRARDPCFATWREQSGSVGPPVCDGARTSCFVKAATLRVRPAWLLERQWGLSPRAQCRRLPSRERLCRGRFRGYARTTVEPEWSHQHG